MIEAHFSATQTHAAISGAYQYDTGQRLRLTGLPSPSEIERSGEMIAGGSAAVQVHFSWTFEESADVVLAEWDDWYGAWVCSIPDEYMTRHAEVNVHVTIYYGEKRYDEASAISEDGESGIVMTRMETEYDAVFIPRSRPAPYGVVTPEQQAAWEAKAEDITLALTANTTAQSSAQARTAEAKQAAADAQEAAQTASEAAEQAQDAARAAGSIGGVEIVAVPIAAGEAPTAVIDGGRIVIGQPRGADGAKGEAGEDGPSDIELAYSAGALTITPR